MSLPKTVRLGVSPLSWINEVIEEFGRDTPAETCLREAAEAGYTGVETSRKLPTDPGALTELLGGFGLNLASGWHSGRLAEDGVEAEMTAVAHHARLLSAMGCKVMVYGETAMMADGDPLDVGMSARRIMSTDEVPAYARRLTDFAHRLMEEYGLRLAYHHHLMMVAETGDEIDRLMHRTGPEVGLLLDTGHAAAGGVDYTHLIERHGDRVAHIHLKDLRKDVFDRVRREDLSFNAGVRAGMFTVPGDGDLDFAPLARFVEDSGYAGWLVVEAEQDPALAPPLPAVSRAQTHITSLFGDGK
jgi:inosose dehydratase